MLLHWFMVLSLGFMCRNIHGEDNTFCSYLNSIHQKDYIIHTLPKTWNQAKSECEREGSFLFYPRNRIDAESAAQYYKCQTNLTFDHIFIGVADWIVEDVFVTVDGHPMTAVYHNWTAGEPNNDGDRDGCVVLDKNLQLRDDSCSTRYPYICVIKNVLSILAQSGEKCGLRVAGYKYNRFLNRCYKFHLTPRNWTDAYATCKAEMSYLAVINSEAEANHLVDVIATAGKEDIKGDYLRGAVHLGFRKMDNTISLQPEDYFESEHGSVLLKNLNSWGTVTGEPLLRSGYNSWGFSHRLEHDENCGSMFYNGQLNDIGCHQKMFFICEHEIEM